MPAPGDSVPQRKAVRRRQERPASQPAAPVSALSSTDCLQRRVAEPMKSGGRADARRAWAARGVGGRVRAPGASAPQRGAVRRRRQRPAQAGSGAGQCTDPREYLRSVRSEAGLVAGLVARWNLAANGPAEGCARAGPAGARTGAAAGPGAAAARALPPACAHSRPISCPTNLLRRGWLVDFGG